MFDYPTVADLTDYIVAQFSDGDEGDEAAVGGLPQCYITCQQKSLSPKRVLLGSPRRPGSQHERANGHDRNGSQVSRLSW